MSDQDGTECRHQSEHQAHLCQLKKKGLTREIAARTNAPGYICHNCNAAANRAEDLCNPSPFIKRA
jgi:hypothetical protein